MTDLSNLSLRGRTWWVVRSVPPALRPLVGMAKLRRNLNTSDLAEALRQRPIILGEMAAELEQSRREANGETDPVMTTALALRRSTAYRVAPDGTKVPDPTVMASILAEERAKVARLHGPEMAKRFESLATAKAVTPVDAHFVDYQAESGVKEKTKYEQRGALKRFMTWDPRLSIELVDRKLAGRYVTKSLGDYTSNKTKNQHITFLSGYWKWLVRKGFVDDNPWRGQLLPVKARSGEAEATERPFTADEITMLLATPAVPGLTDAMWIAALSGMRREEISMLRVADCVDGIFNIRRAKTRAGQRLVPIHPDLSAIVARRCTNQPADAFLLPELGPAPQPDAVRGRGTLLGQRFERHRKSLKVEDNPDGRRRSLANFHSFRRWFVTEAERAGQPPWLIESVVGHARTGMTLGVYSNGPSMEQMRVVVEAVRLPAPGQEGSRAATRSAYEEVPREASHNLNSPRSLVGCPYTEADIGDVGADSYGVPTAVPAVG
jgi:integrase